MIFAFPCGQTRNRPAMEFAHEHAVAIGEDFDTMLIDVDDMEITRGPYKQKGQNNIVVWRGRAMSENEYRSFVQMLKKKSYQALVSPYAYMAASSADKYFDYIPPKHSIGAFTIPYPDCLNVELIREKALSITTTPDDHRLFVKDYVQSVAGHTMIDIDDDDAAIVSELETIIEKRGKAFSGGLAFKDFREHLEDETRFMLVNEKVVVAAPHGNGVRTHERFPSLELPLLINPPSPFYTVDVAWCKDAQEWVVVDVNDGQTCKIPYKYEEELYGSFRWGELETKLRGPR